MSGKRLPPDSASQQVDAAERIDRLERRRPSRSTVDATAGAETGLYQIVHAQQIDAGSDSPTVGNAVVIPAGSWSLAIGGSGEWDRIYAAMTGDQDAGAWVASRPEGDGNFAAGTLLVGGPLPGGSYAPAAMVAGDGHDVVTVVLTFTPCRVAVP